MPTHFLPFGRFKRVPLTDLDDSYLQHVAASCLLGRSLRAAVESELRRRGMEIPPDPTELRRDRLEEQRTGPCLHCGSRQRRAEWMRPIRGRTRIRCLCSGCGAALGLLPPTEENREWASASLQDWQRR